MKKFLSVLSAFLLMSGSAFALTLTDVTTEYWAAKEIAACVRDGVIRPYADSSFRPNVNVKRSEFNSMLLRALGHKPTEIQAKSPFKDLKGNHWAFSDIMKSEEIGLLYGYPDGTFRPETLISRVEVASILSHITKNSLQDMSVLEQFVDSNDIPDWGKKQYAKSIELGLYANYPDLAKLLPNKPLNRAEAAVILHRLRMAMGLVKEQYVAKDAQVEQQKAPAPTEKVSLLNFRRIVLAGNVVRAAFTGNIADLDENLKFTFVNDVYTEEGNLLIPRGSVLNAEIKSLDSKEILDKNTKVSVTFDQILFPSGKVAPIQGHVFDRKGVLTAGKLATFGKIGSYTIGSAVTGVGSGIGVAAVSDPKKVGEGSADAGSVTGLVTPGLHFKADVEDSLLIELTQDLDLEENL